MKLFDIEYLLKNDVKFSLREVEKYIVWIMVGTIALVVVAILTFEGEYFTGITLEKSLEYFGVLNENWIGSHQTLFLHEVQLIFIISFMFEIHFIISRYMKGWKL